MCKCAPSLSCGKAQKQRRDVLRRPIQAEHPGIDHLRSRRIAPLDAARMHDDIGLRFGAA
jgi:hypothetical protein